MDTEIALPLNRPMAPASTASDPRLVVEAQAGGRAALDELARRLRRPAYVLALQLVGNRDDALDIAQDALLRLFQHLGRVAPDRPVRPWLFAIVRNRARDLWRSRAARPSESLDARPDLSAHLTAPTGDPEARAFVENLHALKRMAEPEEIARPVLHLASEAASFITGTALLVDGGVSINLG